MTNGEKYKKETVAEVLAEFGGKIELMRKCKCVGVSLWDSLKFKLRIEAAHGREVEKSRALVEGLLDATTTECATCDYDCGPNRENCICRQARGWLDGEATPKTVSGVDRDAIKLSKKLMAVFVEMVQWRGVLSEDEENLLKALVRYTESIKEGAVK